MQQTSREKVNFQTFNSIWRHVPMRFQVVAQAAFLAAYKQHKPKSCRDVLSVGPSCHSCPSRANPMQRLSGLARFHENHQHHNPPSPVPRTLRICGRRLTRRRSPQASGAGHAYSTVNSGGRVSLAKRDTDRQMECFKDKSC